MHSALWSILQQLLRQGLVATFVFVLARRVSPAEFGLIGIANVWNTFFYLFLELGFAAALVQRKEITPAHIASAFVTNAVAGASLMLVSMIASGPISAMMKAPQAQAVIFTVSISFFVTSLASTQLALAQRELQFKALAIRDFAANTIAAITGIALALTDFGVWAVVANSVLLNILGLIFVWRITPHRIDLREFRLSAARELWSFGSQVFAYTGLKYFLRSADSLLVGFLFGPEKLGLYNFAQRVTTAPTKAIQIGLATFLFPRASKLQESPEHLRELFILSAKILNHVLLLFSIMLATVGMELLLVVFGRQWTGAVQIIRILIFIQLLTPAIIPLSELMKATNRPNWLWIWTVFMTCLTAAALFIGAIFNFQVSLISLAVAWWLTLPLAVWMIQKVTNLSAADLWRQMRLSYLLATITGAAVFLVWKVWSANLPALVVSTSILGLLHIGAAYAFDPDLRRIPKLIRNRS